MDSDAAPSPIGAPDGGPPIVSVCLPERAAGALPLVIRWRVPAGSYVMSGQVLAHLFPPAAAATAATAATAEAKTGDTAEGEGRQAEAAAAGYAAMAAAAAAGDDDVAATAAAGDIAAAGDAAVAAAGGAAAGASAGKAGPCEWLLRAPVSGTLMRLRIPSNGLVTDPEE